MKITPLSFKDVLLIEPEVFKDERGFFFESFNQRTFNKLIGREVKFVQDNQSRSKKNVIRGLHFQIEKPQIKLIKVISGSIFDVVVDIRKQSKNFGKHISVELNAEDNKQLWIPEGFAHGFLVLSEIAEVQYKVSEFWDPELEQSLLWSDEDLNINWPLSSNPIISSKDQKASLIKDF
ncbi:dTDP-4-dehydrorhamnose 3,5-epimerase [Methylophilaceae bacterium]|nr:dTDP-4-dehydrorhamnose 3,5-epimerase [Methylophilaceae bacterium]|tara:strand:+ start:481 stop:1014 length:534 start_codon:yes stop_codon:yes gene_type:complete